ncbi:hypothetical protein TYRP_015725 [Tyrophagus putrescentiae]|nr:hypothetical protein TYRP_015725 [Tyrophagus putrescentiae]
MAATVIIVDSREMSHHHHHHGHHFATSSIDLALSMSVGNEIRTVNCELPVQLPARRVARCKIPVTLN